MELDIRLLRYFLAVAEDLNVTRAAELLHVAQPALSQQIQLLERIVGVPLFLRDRRRLQLTEVGRGLIPHAQSILSSIDSARLEAQATAHSDDWSHFRSHSHVSYSTEMQVPQSVASSVLLTTLLTDNRPKLLKVGGCLESRLRSRSRRLFT
jgi:DNA-binding transcriptional LysR family regulator